VSLVNISIFLASADMLMVRGRFGKRKNHTNITVLLHRVYFLEESKKEGVLL